MTRITNEKIDYKLLRKNVLNWIESMRSEDDSRGMYRFSHQSPPGLYPSLFAILARELFDDLANNMTLQEKQEYINYIKSYQDAQTGIFHDSSHIITGKSGGHDLDYVTWQTTYFSMHALDALNAYPKYEFHFLEQFLSDAYLIQWLESLDLKHSWRQSNIIMFLLSFYFFYYRKTGEKVYRNLIDISLDWLDKKQDPHTGFWGTDVGASLMNGMAGAYHFYIFYYAAKRDIHYKERIIDSVLSLQNRKGLFAYSGGSCVDFDPVDILVNVSKLSDYRALDVRKALTQAFIAILKQQNPDGGFPEKHMMRFNFLDWFDVPWMFIQKHRDIGTLIFNLKSIVKFDIIPNRKARYSGILQYECPARCSDMWSAWFRPLAIASIVKRYPDQFSKPPYRWRFRKLPGLGYNLFVSE